MAPSGPGRDSLPRVPKLPAATLRAPLLGALLVLLVVATAIAANRPQATKDLTNDGTLKVVVVDWLGAAPRPVVGADVEVAAVRDGEVIGTSAAVTDSGGVAVLAAVPRAIAGSPVALHVAARRSGAWVDDDGCARAESWSGEPAIVASAIGASVELAVAHTSSMICAPTWGQVAAVADTPSEPAGGSGPPLGAALLIAAVLTGILGVARLLRRVA